METINYEVVELSQEEVQEIEGGFMPILLASMAICGGIYGAGVACGQALYYATH